MSVAARRVAVLGSTGSIGRNALEVIDGCEYPLRAVALSARHNLEQLAAQARRYQPRWLIATDEAAGAKYKWQDLPRETEVVFGQEGIQRVVSDPEVEIVLAAIVGSAGLTGAWAALEAGKTVALANKETLVMAGPLVMKLAAERKAAILPVDSEHSAVFQALQAGRRGEVHKIILTASGGPFRAFSKERLASVAVADALAHPTWQMGPKITVDSATMMNKALEIIEARWLFDLRPEQIEVAIHPQSIVHSLVEYRDGSVVAQMGPPDMKLPIQYALTYPERCGGPALRLDLTAPLRLDFEPPDRERFPALELGYEVARAGGTAGAVLNAANEAAVAAFLEGRLPFTQIVPACRRVLEEHEFDPGPSLADLLRLDRWAREEINRWIGS